MEPKSRLAFVVEFDSYEFYVRRHLPFRVNHVAGHQHPWLATVLWAENHHRSILTVCQIAGLVGRRRGVAGMVGLREDACPTLRERRERSASRRGSDGAEREKFLLRLA